MNLRAGRRYQHVVVTDAPTVDREVAARARNSPDESPGRGLAHDLQPMGRLFQGECDSIDLGELSPRVERSGIQLSILDGPAGFRGCFLKRIDRWKACC